MVKSFIRKSGTIVGIGLMVLFIVGVGRAQEPDFDHFDLRFGGAWVFGANTDMALLGQRGIGTAIDYRNTLGGDASHTTYRFDGTWRWALKHSLTYTYYNINRNSERVINRDIDFGDQTFSAGADVKSQLDMRLNRFLYRYSLVHNDDINFELGAGLYIDKIDLGLNATTTVGPTVQTQSGAAGFRVPLPTFGVNTDVRLSERWAFIFSADWFYVKLNAWEGAQSDVMFGLKYKILKNWSLGAAYDRFTLNGSGPVKGGTFKVDNSWNSLFGFLSFHW
jgi:hypothetical protein